MIFFFVLAFIAGCWLLNTNYWFVILASYLYVFCKLIKTSNKKTMIYYLLCFCGGVLFSKIEISASYKNEIKIGCVVEAKENYYILRINLSKYYVYEKDNTKEIGDVIKGYINTSELSFTSYESQLDFQTYLNHKGVFQKAFVAYENIVFKSFIRPKEIKAKVLLKLTEKNQTFTSNIIWKESDSLMAQLTDEMMIRYYLMSTGVHYSLIIRVLNKTVFRGVRNKKTKDMFSCMALIPFSIILPFSYSLLRIMTYKTISYIARKKSDQEIFIFGYSMLALLIINPYFVFQSFFLLGFGISLFFRYLFSYVGKLKKGKKIITFVLSSVFVIVLSCLLNQSFNILASLNTLYVPIFSILYYWTYCFSIIFTNNALINLGCNIYEFIIKILSKLSLIINVGQLTGTVIIMIVILFQEALIFCERKRKLLPSFLLLSIISLLAISSLPIKSYLSYEISFINVGQGDAILIRSQLHALLIDTGGSKYTDIATETLIPFFKKKKIKKLEYVITTHADFDHTGALGSLLNSFPVENVITSYTFFPLNFHGIIFNNLNKNANHEDNNGSFVLTTSFLNKKWLLMGDAEVEVENEILLSYPSLDCDVLKVGHHGSKSSSSLDFLKAITPSLAIISVGANNSYGHPSEEVISRLASLDIEVKRTDLEGTISFYGRKK